ncbi:MAG: GNAT family N-acetyltransferase [Dysgonomonas sp.]|nr:GNAT family N-acetyltransferase [Dysgonomonas sp.]
MLIRQYISSDKESVLHLLKLNTPLYFSPIEEKDLIYYLDNEIEYYYVAEEKGKILGAAGINLANDKTLAKLSWDIIHPESHGKGIGTKLTNHRIEEIKKINSVNTISVRTSQLVYKFYERFGLKLQETVKDYWDKGLDLYTLACKTQEISPP